MCNSNLFRIAIPEEKIDTFSRKKFGYFNGGIVTSLNDSKFCDFLDFASKNNGGVLPSYVEIQKIKCGKCIACRLEYSKEWAQRCVCESTLYDSNWFITLTYDDEHIQSNVVRTVSPWSHNLEFVPQLVKSDFTLFKKRLLEIFRSKFGHTGIRFYMCGEYGSETHRPHFHALLFNCPFPDLKLIRNVSVGGKEYCYYTSDLLSKVWGKGFVTIGHVNWNTCSYVARYIIKKQKGSNLKEYLDLCELEGVEPIQQEYVNMSRDPGIANEYFNNNFRDIYKIDKVILPDGKTCQPSHYFDKLFDIFCPEDLANIKSERTRRAQLRQFSMHKGKNVSQVAEIDKKHSESLERIISNKLKRNLK